MLLTDWPTSADEVEGETPGEHRHQPIRPEPGAEVKIKLFKWIISSSSIKIMLVEEEEEEEEGGRGTHMEISRPSASRCSQSAGR